MAEARAVPSFARLVLVALVWCLALPAFVAGAETVEKDAPLPTLDLDLLGSSAWDANSTLASRAGDNLRWALDGSARLGWSTSEAEWIGVEAIGLDAFTVVPGTTRDWLRINVQLYAVRADIGQSHPWAFDGEGRWRFQPRNTFLDALLLPRERLTWRIGHYELPWGIEARIDTNGTLRQYNSARDLGIKTDWGTALTGRLGTAATPRGIGALEWIVSLSRGSGNQWHGGDAPWLALGRLATPGDRSAGVGFGLAGGEVRVAGQAPAQPRWRLVLDGYWNWRRLELRGEIAGGRNGTTGAAAAAESTPSSYITAVVETDLRLREDTLLGYLQLLPRWQRVGERGTMELELRSGLLWRLLPGLAFSAEIRQVAAAGDLQEHPTTLFTQIRYRRGGA